MSQFKRLVSPPAHIERPPAAPRSTAGVPPLPARLGGGPDDVGAEHPREVQVTDLRRVSDRERDQMRHRNTRQAWPPSSGWILARHASQSEAWQRDWIWSRRFGPYDEFPGFSGVVAMRRAISRRRRIAWPDRLWDVGPLRPKWRQGWGGGFGLTERDRMLRLLDLLGQLLNTRERQLKIGRRLGKKEQERLEIQTLEYSDFARINRRAWLGKNRRSKDLKDSDKVYWRAAMLIVGVELALEGVGGVPTEGQVAALENDVARLVQDDRRVGR